MNPDPEQRRCFPRENNQGEVLTMSQEATAGWFVRILLQLVNFVESRGWGERPSHRNSNSCLLGVAGKELLKLSCRNWLLEAPGRCSRLWKSRKVLLFHHGTAQNISRFFPLGWWELSCSYLGMTGAQVCVPAGNAHFVTLDGLFGVLFAFFIAQPYNGHGKNLWEILIEKEEMGKEESLSH